MGARIRSFDWAATPLGPIESWSPALRTMLPILLANRFPQLLWWGPHYVQFYNDPYRPIPGAKHPDMVLGRPGSECWAEVWHVIGPLVDRPFHGGPATWDEDILLEIKRHGFAEETHFTIAYSPVPDQTVPSGIGGVLATVHEITEKVVGQRRILALRDLGAQVVGAKTAEEACASAAKTLASHDKDLPFVLLYLIDADGNSAHLAGAAGVETGRDVSPLIVDLREAKTDGWPLAEARQTETIQVVERLGERFASLPPGPWSDPPQTAVVVPIPSNRAHEPAGLMVAGVSARLNFDDYYRDFFDLVKTQVATAIANARAYEEERKRVEALAELDLAKTAFFSNVSHEFRTPLTLMLAPLEDTLARPDGLTAEDRERLEVAHRNSLRLLKLVNTLLDFSRIEAERVQASYEPTDLPGLTEELASVFRSAIERADLRLVVNCPPLAESVYVDREMWEKIVLNLLSNAFKFTFEGEIEVSLRQAGNSVELAVRDTGTGIPADELPHVFDRFHRIKAARGRTFEGSGIGLALVQELAKLHGGAVRAESEVDRGSTFIVTIPLGKGHLPADRIEGARALASTGVRGEAYLEEAMRWLPDEGYEGDSRVVSPLIRQETRNATTVPGRRPRILLADDNADMREYVRRLLSQHYEVEAVADGLAALQAVRDRAPDLVLADVMMPELDGFGLLRELRAGERTATVPVIMLSARAGEEARVEGMEAGADDYVIKPFSARELLARVGAHLEIARVRRNAEQRLRQSEEQYRRLVDLLPVAVYTCEAPTGVITFHNGHAAKLWGREPRPGDTDERFCGSFRLWRPDGTLLPHDQTPMAVTLRDGREIRNEEVIVERPDGSRINVFVNINPIRDETGRIIAAINAFQDTTALKRAQEQVQEQRRALELTTEAAQVGIWQWNIKTGDITWSAIHKKLWGYEPAAVPLTYEDWAGPIEKNDLARAERAIEDSLQRRSQYDIEYRIKAHNEAETRWVRSIGRPVFNDEGEAVLMRGVSLDVTQRKRAEEAFRYRTEQFETLLNQAPLGVYVVDADFRVREANPIALSAFGDIDGGVIGRDFEEIIHIVWGKPFADELVHIFRHTMETGEPYIEPERAEYRIDRGVIEYYERRLDRITLPDGRHGLVCYLRDISEQVRARRAIAESEHRFRTFADAMPQIAWGAQPDGHIDYYNERWYEYTGFPRGDPDPSGWQPILHPEDAQRSGDAYAACIRDEKPFQIECRFKERKTGDYRWFMGRALPIRDEQGQVVRWFGTFTDIDDQKRLEAGLWEADRRKDEFLAMLGHELRNPLAAITSGVGLLQSNPSPERRVWVEQMIERQVTQLQRLVDDLLDVTRITQGKIQLQRERIELAKPLGAAVESVRGLLDARRHQFSLSLPSGSLLLLADPARVEQILVNLLTNAAKYTPEGGQISLSVERSGPELVIRCRDNGVGLPEEMLDLVFDPFVQADPKFDRTGSGLGMGLTLVKRLTEMHGGTVAASSAGLGMGSEFVLRLPALATDQPAAPTNGKEDLALETSSPSSRRILLIDDNRDLAESLAIFLRGAGHRVVLAHDGETGIAAAERERPDVVLLDLGLPGLDGYVVAEKMRGMPALRDLTIIAISGYTPVDDEKSRKARLDAHLVKPVSYDQLLGLLREKMATRLHVSQISAHNTLD